jgi:hypothetical protein
MTMGSTGPLVRTARPSQAGSVRLETRTIERIRGLGPRGYDAKRNICLFIVHTDEAFDSVREGKSIRKPIVARTLVPARTRFHSVH